MTADTGTDSNCSGDESQRGTRPRRTGPRQPSADPTVVPNDAHPVSATDGKAVDAAADMDLATDVDPPPELRSQILAAARRARRPRPKHPDRKSKT